MKKTVPYITGDGVGVEITPAMQAIVNAAVKKAYGNEHEIEWKIGRASCRERV